jgi:carboxymethylenebutenolidase
MCFAVDSRPPIAPIAGGALDGALITLTSEDGAAFTAFRARPARPGNGAILVLPDVRGLHTYYEELALRYAEHGVEAIAIDFFGRTAGLGERGADFDWAPHVPQTRWETLAADIRTAVRTLRAPELDGTPGPDRVFVTGFCMGGRLAFLAGTLGLELAGVIGFYGWPVGPSRNGTPAPADLASAMSAPVLAIYGAADEGIPAENVAIFDAALAAAGVAHRSIAYPGAPHSFFDRKAEEFAGASASAWAEVVGFIAANGGSITSS